MHPTSILVVEDNREHATLISDSLGEGYLIDNAETMSDALLRLAQRRYDLVLLDVILPDGDGYQVCTHIKSHSRMRDVPVIFLSSKKDVTDKVIGFTLGAEDYIVKPCAPLELKARVDSRIKKKVKSDVLILNGLQFHFLLQKVILDTEEGCSEIDLTPREYKLLTYMARNPEIVLSREQILRTVWGEHMHVSDRSIDTHVASLRKKLGPYSSYIRSVHGTGYRFCPSK